MVVRRYSDLQDNNFQSRRFNSADLKNIDTPVSNFYFGRLFSRPASIKANNCDHHLKIPNSRISHTCTNCQHAVVGGFISCQYCGHALPQLPHLHGPLGNRQTRLQQLLRISVIAMAISTAIYFSQSNQWHIIPKLLNHG